MNTWKKLSALLGAGALVMGMLAATAGTALAADNTQYWQGNGTTDGAINTDDCATDPSAHQLWVWTGTGANVWISVDGELVAGVLQGNGSYHFTTGWHDIGDLTVGDGGDVFVTYDGAADGNAVLTLSHGCAGEEETAPPTEAPSFESSQEGQTDAPSDVPTDAPSFESSQEADTDAPTEPSTDALGTAGTSGPADGAWLLVIALGVLLASVVVLTPARAKSRR